MARMHPHITHTNAHSARLELTRKLSDERPGHARGCPESDDERNVHALTAVKRTGAPANASHLARARSTMTIA